MMSDSTSDILDEIEVKPTTLHELWDEIGLTQEEKDEEIAKMKENLEQVRLNFVAETQRRCELLVEEIESIKSEHIKMLKSLGAAQSDIDVVQESGRFGTIKTRHEEVQSNLYKFKMLVYNKRYEEFAQFQKQIDMAFYQIGIQDKEKRQPFAEIDTDDLSYEKLTEYQDKAETLNCEVLARSKRFDEMIDEIQTLSRDLQEPIPRNIAQIIKSRVFSDGNFGELMKIRDSFQCIYETRAKRISEMGVEINKLWDLLRIDETERKQWLQMHNTLSQKNVEDCIREAERLTKLRNENIDEIIDMLKLEINGICRDLNCSEEQEAAILYKCETGNEPEKGQVITLESLMMQQRKQLEERRAKKRARKEKKQTKGASEEKEPVHSTSQEEAKVEQTTQISENQEHPNKEENIEEGSLQEEEPEKKAEEENPEEKAEEEKVEEEKQEDEKLDEKVEEEKPEEEKPTKDIPDATAEENIEEEKPEEEEPEEKAEEEKAEEENPVEKAEEEKAEEEKAEEEKPEEKAEEEKAEEEKAEEENPEEKAEEEKAEEEKAEEEKPAEDIPDATTEEKADEEKQEEAENSQEVDDNLEEPAKEDTSDDSSIQCYLEKRIEVFMRYDAERIRLKKFHSEACPILELIRKREDIIEDYEEYISRPRRTKTRSLAGERQRDFTQARDFDALSQATSAADDTQREQTKQAIVHSQRASRRYKQVLPRTEKILKATLLQYKEDTGEDFLWDGKPMLDKLKHVHLLPTDVLYNPKKTTVQTCRRNLADGSSVASTMKRQSVMPVRPKDEIMTRTSYARTRKSTVPTRTSGVKY